MPFETAVNEQIPRVGMLAKLRNRRGVIASVEPYDGATEGRLHLVRIEYTDTDGILEDTILWEREVSTDLLEPSALPRVESDPSMDPGEFDALVRATRWEALRPFLDPKGSSQKSEFSIASPFFGAVQVDDFQLVPLLQALQMPRVSLLLADDVGLDKTVEAGPVLTELLLRRRIRRVLVLTPASLRQQWQDEMKSKFALSFDLVDRQETHQLQKRLGLDANPWRVFPKIVASYHYLRQPDILQQFLATCHADGTGPVRAQLPWDLLVVDEAHNLMPSSFGRDSQLVNMLRTISPFFEHKLFLTATPHNGHTRSFSGLLELLDPVRFTQTTEFKPDERKRVEEVVTHAFGVKDGELVGPLPYLPPNEYSGQLSLAGEVAVRRAKEIWADIDTDLRAFTKREAESLTSTLQRVLASAGEASLFAVSAGGLPVPGTNP
jgi:hypothetical protein